MENDFARIQNVLDYIEENLKDELKTDEAISVSGYSTTHGYRIFGSLTGWRIGEYIRLRRLSSAIEDYNISGRKLIDISLDYGYGSQEAFTRAFKKEFGVTPGFIKQKNIKIETIFKKLEVIENYEIIDNADIGIISREPKKIEELSSFNYVECQEFQFRDLVPEISPAYSASVGIPKNYNNTLWFLASESKHGKYASGFFPGGIYVSMKSKIKQSNICWRNLSTWLKLSRYELRENQYWLENLAKESFHIPIKESKRSYLMEFTDDFREIQMVNLCDMRVVYYKMIGENPEEPALKTIADWAKEKGLHNNCETRVFGYDKPEPKEGERMHGYEFCITIPDNWNENDCYPFPVKTLPGGEFGSIKFKFGNMRETWKTLIKWMKHAERIGYKFDCPLLWREETFCLKNHYENLDDTDMILYIPVSRK